MMMDRQKAVAFDVDPDSLSALREALPGWDIEATAGATVGSLARDWRPAAADLLVIGDQEDVARALGPCRGLRSEAGRAEKLLPVLVPPARRGLGRAELSGGGARCPVVPV